VCGQHARRFLRAGTTARDDALCFSCGALERHRLLWLFLTRRTDLLDGRPRRMLHVAPEPCLEQRLRERIGEAYLTADLHDPRAMVQMDICDMDYPDGAFDVIYCSHVLEHIPDDRQAMRELHRTLAPDGWAVLSVPISSAQTFEDPSIVEPAERLRAFGQADHVRSYGPDFADRLREAGFGVTIFEVSDVASPDEVVRMGLARTSGVIHYCTK